MMRSFLDGLYRLSGLAAAVSLLVMLFLVIAQMIARWVEVPVTGLPEIAGYCMGVTSFLGLGYALHNDSHIRVNLIISHMGSEQRAAEIVCTGIALLIATGVAIFAIKTTVLSYRFNEISQGQDAVAIWIPQLAMSIGSIIFLVALVDRIAGLIVNDEHWQPSSPVERAD